MPKSVDEVLQDLQKKTYLPVYILHGDEPYYTEKIIDVFENDVLSSADRSFNQFVLFGKDITIGTLLSYAKRFPMMAERQLIIVKEAQDIPGLDTKEQTKYLEDYFLHPLSSTILVLGFKSLLDERKSYVKSAEKRGVIVPSKKLYDNKIPDWIADYCHKKGVKISPKAIQMLAESVGNDLKRLAGEIEKILLNLTVKQEITAEVVERFVGVSKEYNIFEFQKAILQRNILKANQIASHFAANPKENPLVAVIIILFNFFSKLLMVHATKDKSEQALAKLLGVNPYFTKDYLLGIRNFSVGQTVQIIKYLRLADAQSKGIDSGSQSEGELLRELVFKILH